MTLPKVMRLGQQKTLNPGKYVPSGFRVLFLLSINFHGHWGNQQRMYLSHEIVGVGRWEDALASKGWHFLGWCSQMNGLLSQVLDLSNNEHVFLSPADIHDPATTTLSLYELVLSPLHGRNVMYGISNSQGCSRPLFQVVIDRGSNHPAVQVWYFNPVPSNINTHTKKGKACSTLPDISRPRRYVFVQLERMEYLVLWNMNCSMEQHPWQLPIQSLWDFFFKVGSLTIKISSKLGLTLQKISSNSSLH